MLVEHFLQRQEITEAVVESAFYYALGSVTSYDGGGERPSVLVQARGVLQHGAEHIVGVGVREVSSPPRGELGGISRDVGGSSHIAESVGGRSQSDVGGLRTERAAGHAAELRVVEPSAHGVVEVESVHIARLPVLVKSAKPESHRAELEVGRLVIYVVGGTLDRPHRLAQPLVVQKFLFVEQEIVGIEGGGVETCGSKLYVAEILDHAIHYVHIYVCVFISGGDYFKDILAHLGVRDGEYAVRTAGDQNPLVAQQHVGVGHGRACAAVKQRSLDSGGSQPR